MADNKNQHFVPRVHLRPFTVNGEGLAINLFNLDRMKAIPNAPVRNQCSGDYFYGQNKLLENAINFIEDPYGPIVRHLSDGGAVGSAVKVVLKRFIYLQYLRTEAASLKASEMALALQDVPGSDLPVPTVKEASKEAVQAAMLNYKDTMRIVDDLTLCIARNRSDLPFFTSDDPAILTNRLHIQRPRKGRPSFGVKTAGAIFSCRSHLLSAQSFTTGLSTPLATGRTGSTSIGTRISRRSTPIRFLAAGPTCISGNGAIAIQLRRR
jgi:hypothetical protein